jgi:hypothetical protein
MDFFFSHTSDDLQTKGIEIKAIPAYKFHTNIQTAIRKAAMRSGTNQQHKGRTGTGRPNTLSTMIKDDEEFFF